MADRDSPTVQTKTPSSVDEKLARGRVSTKSIGTRLGRYTIQRLIGAGGVGAVYEADDPELGRRVAIKVLREDRQADTEGLRREAQALAKLVHQNVIMVYDVGVADGEVFLVMQLVESVTIDDWLVKQKADVDTIIAKFRQAGEGLVAAHAAGLVHCDFKPTNVLVDSAGVVRVSDFGLARIAQLASIPVDSAPPMAGMTTVAGTPAYMAPEQFDGKVAAASDQFAFCVALWECLAGERPFEVSTGPTLDPKVRSRRPLRRDVKMPKHVMRALERGMSEDPKQRFPSMAMLLEALQPRTPWIWYAAAIATVTFFLGGSIAYFVFGRHDKGPWEPPDGKPVLLTSFGTQACAYSPMVDLGGKRVVFDRTHLDAVDLYEVPLAGGSPRQLTHETVSWEWRAQPGRRPGEVIYLVHDQEDTAKSQVAFLDLDTGVSTPIVTALAWDATVVGDSVYYSPDAFAGIRKITANVDQPFLEPTQQDKYFLLSSSRDRTRLAVTKLTANYGPTLPCIADIKTAKLDCLPYNASARPVFGTDNKSLYLATYDGILRRDLTAGTETYLARNVRVAEGGLAISPDGGALVYSTCLSHSKLVDITTDETLIDNNEEVAAVAVSMQENTAWIRDAHGVYLLTVHMRDGSDVQLTTAMLGSVAGPRFSPDGQKIVFATSEPNPGLRIAYLDRVGQIHQLTNNVRDANPVWTEGGVIGFTRTDTGGNQEAYVMPADGGEPKRLSTSTRTIYGARGKELLVGGPDGMYWADPQTGAERPGPERPPEILNSASTSPSGNWVVYSAGTDGQTIYRVRVEPPAKIEHVVTFTAGDTVTNPAIRDDGHVIAGVGRWYGDLVRLNAKAGSPF